MWVVLQEGHRNERGFAFNTPLTMLTHERLAMIDSRSKLSKDYIVKSHQK